MYKRTIYIMLGRMKTLEDKFDLLDTMLCLTIDDDIIDTIMEVQKELYQEMIRSVDGLI